MDSESTKLAIQIGVGAMVFVGAVLTFVNGRLNDAKTQEAREKVWYWLVLATASLFYFTGTILPVFQIYRISPLLLVVSLAIHSTLFIRATSSPVGPSSVAAYCINCSIHIGFIFFVFALAVAHTLQDQIDGLVGLEKSNLQLFEQILSNVKALKEILGDLTKALTK